MRIVLCSMNYLFVFKMTSARTRRSKTSNEEAPNPPRRARIAPGLIIVKALAYGPVGDEGMVLTQEEIDGCRDAFLAFDKDRSGNIDVWELRQVNGVDYKSIEPRSFRHATFISKRMCCSRCGASTT